ncbi:TrmB family transcriptional regulator [Haloplanus aerogenes]|uniref:Sugar-specific transcriptional regulator TrmB n=1 Tax=Haloplanus aerogenes TaxID=660522 RepID=A0A3M0CWC3_9EURY|nr:helix-turn-helix domain-containing protein [Haloplanus aerogenes]AZH25945.1 TrmB family transcriptional regulator [Haloplanus aerogenes]RMB11639.1 sugar-specific transcriptional regulator TrmB [Haloplanus aerogenes]
MAKSALGHSENIDEAIEVLQQLGLKEYEARCFVGLSRLNTGTAKQLSEVTEVPRTRIYDAIRVLEVQGLVETQHSSPQQFRAVSLEEATETLRDQYDDRVERLHDALTTIDIVDLDDESPVQEVWSMSGRTAIENRTNDLIENAAEEVVLVVGDESLLTDDLVTTLNGIGDGVEIIIGALTPSLEDHVQTAVPGATTFISGLEWLHGEDTAEKDTAIGRLVLIDRSAFLVSSIMPESKEEQAIFGEGFGNGLVVIARRLMAQGLVTVRDPGQ